LEYLGQRFLDSNGVAEAIARVLSRSWVDAASGFEVIMTHCGADIAYLARAAGLSDDAASSTEHRKDFECGSPETS
jgi:hypothetical protein